MKPRQVEIAMLFAAAVIYGAIFSVNKLAADAGWPPLSFPFAQAAIAGGVLALVLALRGERLVPTLRHGVSYLVLGALVLGLPIALLTYISPHLPAALMTVVLALSPTLTLLFSVLLRIEVFRLRVLLGIGAGLVGVAVLVRPGSTLDEIGGLGWFLLGLLAPVMFALSNVSAALLRPPATGSLTMTAGILCGAAVVMVPIILLSGEPWLPATAPADYLLPVGLAALIHGVFLYLFFEIIRRAGPTFFAQFNYLAILAGVAWGAILFGERPEAAFWLALAIMLAGVYLAVAPARTAKTPG